MKIGIFIYLIFFFPSSQKEYYLEKDIIEFSFIENLKIIGILFLVSMIYFYLYYSDEKDKFIRIAKTFSQSILIGLLYLLLIQDIIVSVGLLTNRLIEKQEIIEKYEVVEINGKYGEVGLKSIKENYYERTKGKFNNTDLSQLRENDTIDIVFKKGIFGKKYLKNAQIVLKK
ncbi:hypothetical protein [Lutibacter sp.]